MENEIESSIDETHLKGIVVGELYPGLKEKKVIMNYRGAIYDLQCNLHGDR